MRYFKGIEDRTRKRIKNNNNKKKKMEFKDKYTGI
jgi:hypothetical protein